jgi:glyoxylase I family protein
VTVLGPHHFCLVVGDLDRTIDFYSQLGLVPAKRFRNAGDDLGVKLFGTEWGVDQAHAETDQAVMYLNGVAVEFIQCLDPPAKPYHQDPTRAGSAHLAVHVTDIDAEVSRLKAAGVKFHTPVNVHVDGDFVVKWCYLRDPDGICVELVEGAAF